MREPTAALAAEAMSVAKTNYSTPDVNTTWRHTARAEEYFALVVGVCDPVLSSSSTIDSVIRLRSLQG